MAIASELKSKVLEAISKGKLSNNAIAKKFGVSPASITAWNKTPVKTKGKKLAAKKTVAKKTVVKKKAPKASAARLSKAH